MGLTIDGGIYSRQHAIEEIDEKIGDIGDKLSPTDLLDKIIPRFGWVVDDDRFVIIWNEYYEDYNPGTEFLSFISRYYGIEDLWIDHKWITGGACADDVAYELGIDLPEEELDY